MLRSTVLPQQRRFAVGWAQHAQDVCQARRFPTLLLLGLMTLSAMGCVRRRLTIRSNPPGAMVYIDDQQIGTTPVATDFVYYGTRKIKLIKDQYETMSTYHTISAPWYQVPPMDFVSENLVGQEIRDERVLNFNLVPQRVVPPQDLLNRASNLRFSSQQGFAVPIPSPSPTSRTDSASVRDTLSPSETFHPELPDNLIRNAISAPVDYQ